MITLTFGWQPLISRKSRGFLTAAYSQKALGFERLWWARSRSNRARIGIEPGESGLGVIGVGLGVGDLPSVTTSGSGALFCFVAVFFRELLGRELLGPGTWVPCCCSLLGPGSGVPCCCSDPCCCCCSVSSELLGLGSGVSCCCSDPCCCCCSVSSELLLRLPTWLSSK